LPKDIRALLVSEYASNKLAEIGRKYNLAQNQIIALSRYIKNLFISFREERELEVSKLINLLCQDLDINPEKAQAVFQDVNNEILLPALKNIPGESESSKQTSPTKLPAAPEPKNENIVDLKNLPRL